MNNKENKELEYFNNQNIEEPKEKGFSFQFVLLAISIAIGVILTIEISNDLAEDTLSFTELISNIDTKYLIISIILGILIPFIMTLEYMIINHSISNKFDFKNC